MANLEDFSQVSAPSLEDFQIDKHDAVPVSNRASNLNLAAHMAALSDSPEEAMQAYELVNAELDMSGQSRVAESLVNLVKEKNFGKSRDALISYLADPNVSDKEKQDAALRVLDASSELYSTRNMLSVEALSAPSGNESPEVELTRIGYADSFVEVNAYKAEAQRLLNAEAAKSDASTLNAFADIFGYFLPYVESKYAGDILNALREGEGWAHTEALALLGEAKVDIKQMLDSLPPEERLGMTRALIDAVNNHSSIVMPDENDYARVDYLRTTLEAGYYDDFDKWVDNVVSVLDATMLGGLVGRSLAKPARALKFTRSIENAVRDLRRQSVRAQVQPTTVSQNYKETNPAKAQATHEIAAADESGEAAQALYGTTREDAIAHDLLPEVATVDGTVVNKVGNPDRIYVQENTPDPDIMDFVNTNGAIYYWEGEKRAMRAKVVNDFEQAKGLNARKEMFQVDNIGDGVKISAVYGPAQGGFSNAKDAAELAKYALREYGVGDDAITILQRDGDRYVPISRDDWDVKEVVATKRIELQGQEPSLVKHTDADGTETTFTDIGSTVTVRRKPNYLVQVNTEYKFNPLDVTEWAKADVKYNIFDRVNGFNGTSNAGSLQRHILDAHSMLHPNISLGANVAVDKMAALEKQLLQTGQRFSDKYVKFGRDRQALLEKIIREANDKGIEHDYAKLIADGLRPDEIDALKAWREYWDTIYWLRNKDMARTMRARGFYEFVDETSDTRLFAKPVGRNQVGPTVRVYDQASDEIKTLSKDELNQLYENGGTLARLRQPLSVGDDAAEYVLSPNAPGKGYLRAISDSTQVLNYRKGYYEVHYKDPQFIVKVVTDKRGNVLYEKAVATAGSIQDAKLMVNRLSAADGGRYYYRGDKKKVDIHGDDYWDIMQASGMSSQRVRGKRLEDATSTSIDPTQANILDPVDSLIVAAKSTASRISMRDYLETTKTRFIKQYGDFLPTNKWGEKVFPSNISEVRHRGGVSESQKDLADARTTYEYINYLENGYINAIDDFYKATLKAVSDIAGNAGLTSIEKAGRWMAEGRGPSAMGKNVAFNAYLASNPLRQFIVQGHQGLQLVANFPGWVFSGRAVPETTILILMQAGITPPKNILKGAGLTLDEAKAMFKQFDRTGLVASVDKQNLIRGSLSDLADQLAQKDFKPLTWMRKVGFDAGESLNMMTAWLAHRDQALRQGENLADAAVQDMITAKARNYTYNMNAAGDMPYNQNALAVLFQFMQVPHKALTGMLTNRVLTPTQKARLAVFNSVMYTLPPAAMYSWFGGILPDNQEMKDLVVSGLEGYLLNKLIALSTGEDSRIDFSGLSPFDMYGLSEFIYGLVTTDAGALLASTPSGQLLFGNNPRLTNFAKTAARYFNVIDDYEDPTTFSQVANDFAKISSGYSNAFKARYALTVGQKINSLGGVTDKNVTSGEAIAQVFGFPTLDESQRYWINSKLYEGSSYLENDVKEWYKDLKRHVISKYGTESQPDIWSVRVMSEAWRAFGNDNFKAKQILAEEMRRDATNGDMRLYKSIMKQVGIMDGNELRTMIKAIPDWSEEKRQQMLETLDFIDNYKDPN